MRKRWIISTLAACVSVLCLAVFTGGGIAAAPDKKAPGIVETTFGWQLSGAKVVNQGKTKTVKPGVITRDYTVEATATSTTPSTPVRKGTFRVKLSAFSPAADMPGQKAGMWYVQGKWRIADDKATKKEKDTRHGPAVIDGIIRAELAFNPAAAAGDMTAAIDMPSSPAAGVWTVGKGLFTGNERFEGALEVSAAVWPDVAKTKGVKK